MTEDGPVPGYDDAGNAVGSVLEKAVLDALERHTLTIEKARVFAAYGGKRDDPLLCMAEALVDIDETVRECVTDDR